MKRFKYIIQSDDPPSSDCIWLRKGEFLYFDGTWKTTKDNVSISGSEDIIKAPTIRLGNTVEDKAQNIEVCGKLSTSEVVSVDVEGTINNTYYDAVGTYYNGTVNIIQGNSVVVFDVDFNSGETSIIQSYDLSNMLPHIALQIGDSEVVKAYNKERLPTGSFFVAINYGYGTGTWNSTTGGTAHIVTATGNVVYYSISPDGIVEKVLESPDLYWEYTQMGGTKTPTQFALALKGLIDS